ncbi:MAG: hypothetical protein WBV82_13175 [Myxococcaceae bacterium]
MKRADKLTIYAHPPFKTVDPRQHRFQRFQLLPVRVFPFALVALLGFTARERRAEGIEVDH